MDGSYFAILTLLPQSSKHTELTETKIDGRDGVILLFNVGEPIPVTTWFVKKVFFQVLGHLLGNCLFIYFFVFYHTLIRIHFILQPFNCASFFKTLVLLWCMVVLLMCEMFLS